MSTPLRKKRNFKALQLPTPTPVSPISPSESNADLIATRLAPLPGEENANGLKKRPPPLGGNSDTIHAGGGLRSVYSPEVSSTSARRNMAATLSSTLANLDLNASGRKKFDVKSEDLKNLQELGQGNGGSVMKVEHVPTGTIMAKKVCG